MIEHPGKNAWRSGLRGDPEAVDGVTDPQGRIVDLRRLAGPLGPQQGNCLGCIADIIAAHREQDRVDSFGYERAYGGGLDMRDVERAGQSREPVAPIRVWRLLEVIADECQLGIARARIDEAGQQLRKGTHPGSNARMPATVPERSRGLRWRALAVDRIASLRQEDADCGRRYACRLPFFNWDRSNGKAGDGQDQARQQRRYGLLLCDEEESADADREAELPQVRPGRAQARRHQGSQDQVSEPPSAALDLRSKSRAARRAGKRRPTTAK